ncbi:tyrosine-type recombinase/integrase, partial [Salmonella enterica subsp. enterica serovar Montevideo]|nr:tyrosine-type recombinase/integrase [Salmonella enterica subsp. enterica serovar Montevideo]
PYHTRHTFACWLLTAGANPAFIAGQMGHETAQMVYEIYGMWIWTSGQCRCVIPSRSDNI